MARSKKAPWYKDRNTGAKKEANSVIRRHKGIIPNGKSYKRLYCSYNICDWKWFAPEDARAYRK